MKKLLNKVRGWLKIQPQPTEPIQYAEDCIFSSREMYCYNNHKPCYECNCAKCEKFIKRKDKVLK